MGKMYHILVLLHMLLMAYVTSSWTEEQTYEADRYPSAEETLAQVDTQKTGSKTYVTHDYMKNIYEKMLDKNGELSKSGIDSVLGIPDTDKGDEKLVSIKHQVYNFDISNILPEEEVKKGEFRLLWKPSNVATKFRRRSKGKESFRIVILGVSPRKDNSTARSINLYNARALERQTFDVESPKQKWLSFKNISHFLRQIRKEKLHVLKLVVYMYSEKTGKVVAPDEIGFDKHGRNEKEKALLVVFSENMRKKKRYYDAARDEKDPFSSCKKVKMYVDFKTVSGNQILHPDGYEAYRCEGTCRFPLPQYLNATFHATLKTYLHAIDPKLIEPACCVPGRMKGLSVLRLRNTHPVVEMLDIIVDKCACR